MMGSNTPAEDGSTDAQNAGEADSIFEQLKTELSYRPEKKSAPAAAEEVEDAPENDLKTESTEDGKSAKSKEESKQNGEAEANNGEADEAVENDEKEEKTEKEATPELVPMTRPRRLRAPTAASTPIIKIERCDEPLKKRGRPKKSSASESDKAPAKVVQPVATPRTRRQEPVAKPEPPKEPEKCCRICLGKQDLTDIFGMDGDTPIATKIRLICTAISISKKDALPQFICKKCLQSLNVALNFKTLGESTDQELRTKLRRTRSYRETEFVVIDCNAGDAEVEENVDLDLCTDEDEEFRPPSDYKEEEESAENDSDSDFSADLSKKRKRGRPRRLRRRGRKAKNATTIELDSDDSAAGEGKRKRRRRETSKSTEAAAAAKSNPTQCIYCDKTFPSVNDLREHKKIHAGEKPFVCDICDRSFKFAGSFKSHKEHHQTTDSLMCKDCNKRYPNKTELRKHLFEAHGEPLAKFSCEKCKRAFTSEKRLEMHRESKCPGFETTGCTTKKQKQERKQETESIALGRDLFKCVAPLTTTYWSDSFSD